MRESQQADTSAADMHHMENERRCREPRRADPAESSLVDVLTDIEAGHSADVASIGYTGKPAKLDLGAEAVITSMAAPALSLRTPVQPALIRTERTFSTFLSSR
jgi:hypothetical protein